MNPLDPFAISIPAHRTMFDDIYRAASRRGGRSSRHHHRLPMPPLGQFGHLPAASDDSEDSPFASVSAMGDYASDFGPLDADGQPMKLVKVDPEEVGMTSGYKHLYSGKEDKRGRFQWQTKIPEDLGKPAEDAEAMKYALLVRHVKVYNDPRRVLSLHSIVVQSPLLKDLLKDVLSGYPGVTVSLSRLEFQDKFAPLIHRWSVLVKAISELQKTVPLDSAKTATDSNVEDSKDVPEKSDEASASEFTANVRVEVPPTDEPESTTQDTSEASKSPEVIDTPQEVTADELEARKNAIKLEHAKLLYNLLAEEFKDVIDVATDMMNERVMTYELLWTMFQPGSYVYSKVQGQDRIFRLHSSRYGQDHDGNPVCWVTVQYIDYDGVKFGTNKLNLMVRKYDGTQPVTHLPVYPLYFHAAEEELKARLVRRGAKVEELAGSHYRAYNGVGWRIDKQGEVERHTIRGRVVIDGYGWNRFMPNQAIYVTPLHIQDADSSSGDERSGRRPSDSPFVNDRDDTGGMPIDGYFTEELDEDVFVPKIILNDEQKMILSPLVRGYALKEKSWLNFFVNSVSDITFNTRAFESLVLPANQKELILGFTATQQDYRNQFDDVIEGKGRGIILLLCGPPGVGKTLTAESVAEEMRVPLYMMSAVDLGYDARHVEIGLQGVLDMCSRWNAILLLDEADVFMEERSLHELERNKLVSVFLRLLEYYEGIMFLTTNRVQTFDAAFQSRIHISIDYPALSTDSRRTVWENFLKQHDVAQAAAREKPLKPIASAAKSNNTNKVEIDEEKRQQLHMARTLPHVISKRDVDALSLMNMNGRQIKNILKTAQLLAAKRGEGLSKAHILNVLEVTQHLHNATNEKESTRSSIFS